MERRIEKHFCYEGLGFPVHLLNVPMMKTRGEWTPDIDYNQFQKAVLMALATKPFSLTGEEVHFIRTYFGKTLEAFGQEFGVTHVAVMEWEKGGPNLVRMSPATEKCIRLFIIDRLVVEDGLFREGYRQVEILKLGRKETRCEPITLDARQLFDACG